MKWLIGALALICVAIAVPYWNATSSLRTITSADRADAPGTFLDLPDGKLHYKLLGPETGPMIVMVHGFSTPHFIFSQNADALAKAGFRVLLYDHFGRGWSDRPQVDHTIDFYDAELLSLLDGLSIQDPVGLVGLSMGGPIVTEFTLRHPERVNQVALLVPAGITLSGASDSFTAQLIRTPVIGDYLWQVVGRSTLLSDSQYDESGLAPENRLAGDVSLQMDYKGYFPSLLSSLRHFPMSGRGPLFQSLARTDTPLLAIFGGADTTVPIEAAEILTTLAPDADIRVIEDGDHGLNYKHAKTVSPWLVEFFAPLLLEKHGEPILVTAPIAEVSLEGTTPN